MFKEKYYLIYYDYDEEFNKEFIQIIRTLSEEEFKKYNNANNILNDLRIDIAMFCIIKKNYEEYKNYILKLPLNSINNKKYSIMVIELNRLITNLLSSFVSFVNYLEKKYSNIYGEEYNTKFRYIITNCYDNCFVYKFLYHLRNYCQHSSIPITSYKLTKELMNVKEFKYGIDKKILFNSGFNWKKDILDEKEKFDDIINLNEYIDELIKCLNIIIKKVIDLNNISDNILFLNELVNSVDYENLHICISEGKNMNNIKTVVLNTFELEFINNL